MVAGVRDGEDQGLLGAHGERKAARNALWFLKASPPSPYARYNKAHQKCLKKLQNKDLDANDEIPERARKRPAHSASSIKSAWDAPCGHTHVGARTCVRRRCVTKTFAASIAEGLPPPRMCPKTTRRLR